MDSIILYFAASALVLGIGGALALALMGRVQVAGVARSLALIENGVRPSEVSRNEQPVFERLIKPLFESMSNVAIRLSPDGGGTSVGAFAGCRR